jgi:hypothetical protein
MTKMTGHSLLLTCLLFIGSAGQQPQPVPGPKRISSRALEVINQLDPWNDLRLALQRGYTGDGIHREWMDRMRQYGIRQASFVLQFAWKEGLKQLRITNQCFLRQYYEYGTIIRDRKLLQEIRDSGLEEELREAVALRATEALSRLMLSVAQTPTVHPNGARGVIYLNLLDDGSLPILDQAPNIQWQFPRRDLNSAAETR